MTLYNINEIRGKLVSGEVELIGVAAEVFRNSFNQLVGRYRTAILELAEVGIANSEMRRKSLDPDSVLFSEFPEEVSEPATPISHSVRIRQG